MASQAQPEHEHFHGNGEEEYYEGDEGEDMAEDGGEGDTEADPEQVAADLAAQQEKIRQEEEKLKVMMKDVEASTGGVATVPAAPGVDGAPGADTASVDENSIYVGQVDYDVTPEELQAHFQNCGTINRVTILCDKFTGRPKGFAYIEFLEKASVDNAIKMDTSLLKGRPLKVTKKRHNVFGFNRGRGGRRGGFRGRGGFGFWGYRPRGRGYRGGFRAFAPRYHPYY